MQPAECQQQGHNLRQATGSCSRDNANDTYTLDLLQYLDEEAAASGQTLEAPSQSVFEISVGILSIAVGDCWHVAACGLLKAWRVFSSLGPPVTHWP